MVENLRVDVNGAKQPISALAQVTVKSAQLLVVNVFDPAMLSAIEQAIRASNSSLNPVVAKNALNVPVPKASKEYREQLVKQVTKTCEDIKVRLRRVRQDAMSSLKGLEKTMPKDEWNRLKKSVEALTEKQVALVDDARKAKEREITA